MFLVGLTDIDILTTRHCSPEISRSSVWISIAASEDGRRGVTCIQLAFPEWYQQLALNLAQVTQLIAVT